MTQRKPDDLPRVKRKYERCPVPPEGWTPPPPPPDPTSLERAVEWLAKWKQNAGHVDHGGSVYFLQHATGGLIKIGTTVHLESRLQSFNASSHDPRYVYLATIPSAGGFYERIFHHLFEDMRMHSEWFRPEPDLLAFIEEVRNAT